MSDETTPSVDATVDDDAVRGMVRDLRPEWTVRRIDRIDEGTDFVADLGVDTRDGERRVVLKATTADLVAPPIARAEPRLLALAGETDVPVPTVRGHRDDHPEFPAPYYLLDHVGGENLEDDHERLSRAARERLVRDAGRHLAALHELGPLPAVGNLGVADGELTVLDTADHPRYGDFRGWLLDAVAETLDTFDAGGFFPDLADDPERFADLAAPVEERLRAAVPDLPAPDPPTYCHRDYRYGNLLVDPETGETHAVLDWANLLAADPVYNLATTEALLLDPDREDEPTADLRGAFREAYAEARPGFAVDDSVRERLRVYRLTCRLGAMACLPLWHRDATPAERDRRAAEHRERVRAYLDEE